MSCVQHVVIAEYIWLDAKACLRSKTKVFEHRSTFSELTQLNMPVWNYDGSSTGQAIGEYSELILQPRNIFRNPFSSYENAVLVLCDVYDNDGNPIESNTRHAANELFDKVKDQVPWFGIEQEYFIVGPGDIEKLFKGVQGRYYCSVGTGNAFYRHIAEEHLRACLEAGLTISGINAEVAPCQWEYQIGPCEGIDSGDQVWVSRWILERIAEYHGLRILWNPKPVSGNWNGSGCHTNFSTLGMRSDENGLEQIYTAIERLREKHSEHMEVYGDGNKERMLGEYETSKYNEFSFNPNTPVNRGQSIRICYDTINNGKGYFEDRRPASSMDPYIVTAKIAETVCLPKISEDDKK